MKRFTHRASLLPLIIFAAAGLADADCDTPGTLRQNSLYSLLRIDTTYNNPIIDGTTQASAIASTSGESCGGSDPETESEMHPIGEDTNPLSAHATASVRMFCDQPLCLIAKAFSSVSLSGGGDNSSIRVSASRLDTRVTDSCSGCDINAKGQIGSSFAAGWETDGGGIDDIQITNRLETSAFSIRFCCDPTFAGATPESEQEPIASNLFSSLTITYFDAADNQIGRDSFQGVAFVNHLSDGSADLFYSGNYYGSPISPPPQGKVEFPFPPCQADEDCSGTRETYDGELVLSIPAGTDHVTYSGSTTSMRGAPYDVNEDGYVDYYDRLALAAHLGNSVNDPGYAPHADLDFNGTIDAADIAIINAHPCIGDITLDGNVNNFDLSQFTQWFNAGDMNADLTGDGVLNFFDISAFLAIYATGC